MEVVLFQQPGSGSAQTWAVGKISELLSYFYPSTLFVLKVFPDCVCRGCSIPKRNFCDNFKLLQEETDFTELFIIRALSELSYRVTFPNYKISTKAPVLEGGKTASAVCR